MSVGVGSALDYPIGYNPRLRAHKRVPRLELIIQLIFQTIFQIETR
jgi:hypothetical protein